MNDTPPLVTKILLAVAATALPLLAVCAVGWYLAARTPHTVSIHNLDREDRQRLVEEFVEITGRVRSPAWFEPQIAYTLKRDQDLSVWGDRFHSNELGYRSPPVTKEPGVFRVLFVGDSWTYGMGVAFQESFPGQLEALANDLLPSGPRVQAWSLALPGYNTFNEVAALELFYDRLEPDVVILCPTRNDNDSNYFVLPDGTNKLATGVFNDRFGHDHSLVYQYRFLDSFRYQQRWRQAFAALRETEQWLGRQQVPFLLAFVAFWEPAFVHHRILDAGIEAPYLITPQELAVAGPWQGPPPWYHGTPQTYQLIARMVYRMLAETLGWPQLAYDPEQDPLRAQHHRRPPPGDWRRASEKAIRPYLRQVPTHFLAGRSGDGPCAGAMNCQTGLMGRRTTIVLRRRRGADRLAITVDRLEQPTGLYPLGLVVSIPSLAGGSRVRTTVPADGPRKHHFYLPLPADVAPGSVLDVEFRADHATLAPDVLALRSVYIMEIEQQP